MQPAWRMIWAILPSVIPAKIVTLGMAHIPEGRHVFTRMRKRAVKQLG